MDKEIRRLELIRRLKKKNLSLEDYISGIKSGNVIILSKAITLLESKKREDQDLAEEILRCLPTIDLQSKRIGISGSPGAGKSSIIEKLGLHYHSIKRKIAILTIDPSSRISGGSILGDKTRMELLSRKDNVFIRPTASGSTLGGVGDRTRETIQLCEAAGYDTIFIETVGVGQSEIAVHSMTDMFVLLMLPGAGDELQGIKKGIVEIADLIAINKSDIVDKSLVTQTEREYKNALHILQPREDGWSPFVVKCSAIAPNGINELIDAIDQYFKYQCEEERLLKKRAEQSLQYFQESVEAKIDYFLKYDSSFRKLFVDLNDKINSGILPRQEALQIIFFKLANKLNKN